MQSASLLYLSSSPLPFADVRVKGSNAKVDGSFVATILETASVGMLYLAWKSITEGESIVFLLIPVSVLGITHVFFPLPTESWEDEVYYQT